jgi:hypothetical protein
MNTDNVHAAGMVLLLLATIGVIAVGRKPLKKPSLQRVAVGIPAGVLTFLWFVMKFTFKCEVSSNPTYQSLLASLCLIAVIMWVRSPWLTIVSCIVILVTGYQLCSQYHYLVNKTGTYAYLNPLAGGGSNFPCPDPWSKNIKAKPLWHSSFTGIYQSEY